MIWADEQNIMLIRIICFRAQLQFCVSWPELKEEVKRRNESVIWADVQKIWIFCKFMILLLGERGL